MAAPTVEEIVKAWYRLVGLTPPPAAEEEASNDQ